MTGNPSGSHELIRSAIELARVFGGGGRLVVTAPGRHDHARHVAVEFIHPAITGARALPAVAVEAKDLSITIRETDAVLVIENAEHPSPSVPPTALTIRVGGEGEPLSGAHLVRWYHLLWELVQLAFENESTMDGGSDSTNFLYPFLDSSEGSDEIGDSEDGEQTLEATLTASAETKFAQSDELSAATVEQNRETLDSATDEIFKRCGTADGTVLAIGNGGSACDAARLVRLLTSQGIRATSLADDPAVLTALANDLGANMLFSRQLDAALSPADVLVAFSTSGSSPNLLAALDVPAAAGASVIACAGYGGGALCDHPNVDHGLVVESSSVHRVQEAQSALVDQLIERLSKSFSQSTPEKVSQ